MELKDFYYDLPQHLIAQEPLKDRTESKLMVLKPNEQSISHHKFGDIIEFLNPGDCLVLNDTRVMPARLIGSRAQSGGRVEFLLLNRMDNNRWEVMVKPGKKAKVGDIIQFGDGLIKAHILEVVEGGNRIVRMEYEGIWEEVLNQLGEMPLPPYIHKRLEDKERYQTVYSKHSGSAAAPTAGLHFTKELLKKIEEKGVHIAYLTLHVGIGTFRPVKVQNITEHNMHSEYYWIEQDQADIINQTKSENGRVIAVGTTSSRTLESIADENGFVKKSSGWTDIFIYPGYKFKIVDGLITNFHLPESTLIMLVSALAGREFILKAYNEAIAKEYRFFSFGDAMFIANSR